MKKILIISVLINLILALFIICHNRFDVNYDGEVNSKDILDLRNYLIESESDNNGL